MSKNIAICDLTVMLTTDGSWSWENGRKVEIRVSGDAIPFRVGGRSVLTRERIVKVLANEIPKRKYRHLGATRSGGIASVQVHVDEPTLSQLTFFGGKRLVTSETGGAFVITAGLRSIMDSGSSPVPDPIGMHKGSWEVKDDLRGVFTEKKWTAGADAVGTMGLVVGDRRGARPSGADEGGGELTRVAKNTTGHPTERIHVCSISFIDLNGLPKDISQARALLMEAARFLEHMAVPSSVREGRDWLTGLVKRYDSDRGGWRERVVLGLIATANQPPPPENFEEKPTAKAIKSFMSEKQYRAIAGYTYDTQANSIDDDICDPGWTPVPDPERTEGWQDDLAEYLSADQGRIERFLEDMKGALSGAERNALLGMALMLVAAGAGTTVGVFLAFVATVVTGVMPAEVRKVIENMNAAEVKEAADVYPNEPTVGEKSGLSSVGYGLHRNSSLSSVVGALKEAEVLGSALIKFRAGRETDRAGIERAGSPYHVPWVWCEHALVRCDEKYLLIVNGSSFPSHYWYVNGQKVGALCQASVELGKLAGARMLEGGFPHQRHKMTLTGSCEGNPASEDGYGGRAIWDPEDGAHPYTLASGLDKPNVIDVTKYVAV